MTPLPFYSLNRLVRATRYALSGLASVFKSEPAFKLEVVIFLVLAPAALFSDHTALEKTVMVGSLFLVLLAELINTAIETVIDRISPEIHPLSRRAKDIGAAVVLLSLINAAVLWALVLAG
jgi:diacylglycerol kinase (ATP)